ncbi:hypothetical protein BJX76DRAFT_47111 [Aspergillus varians]
MSEPWYAKDLNSLRHIVMCHRWRRLWTAAIEEFLAPTFPGQQIDIDERHMEFTLSTIPLYSEEEVHVSTDWRQKLLLDALTVQGLDWVQPLGRDWYSITGIGDACIPLHQKSGICWLTPSFPVRHSVFPPPNSIHPSSPAKQPPLSVGASSPLQLAMRFTHKSAPLSILSPPLLLS